KPASVPILMYHKVGDDGDDRWWVSRADFIAQLDYLKAAGFETVLPSELAAHVRQQTPLPARPVVLTFDDGNTNLLTVVEPLLKQYGFRGIGYLITSQVGLTASERHAYEGTDCLIWPEVCAMKGRGVIVFGGHTRSHRDLRRVPNPDHEIRGCMDDLYAHAGIKPDSFCYPGGRYHPPALRSVQKAGFSTAVTCENRVAILDEETRLLELPRRHVVGGMSLDAFKALLTPTPPPGPAIDPPASTK
ncbi:MAG: polysaccharide deacetylase family protein, partial [Lentisphaerota bacterium]